MSKIEIWSSEYINNVDFRDPEDRNKRVVRCEHAHDNHYIVEVVDDSEFMKCEKVETLERDNEQLINVNCKLNEEIFELHEKITRYKKYHIVMLVLCFIWLIINAYTCFSAFMNLLT
jgi:hypothetical protein